jgi:hypothetical protein
MKVLLKLDGRTASGGSSLVCHNERLADPLDEIVRSISAISKKRNKTEADHLEIARLEFLGGLYTNGNGPCLPAWNILRSLQDGAKRHKRGVDVLRGVYPLSDHADLKYDGDKVRDPDEMWKAGSYSLRKTVGVQRARTMRTRPMFNEWQAELLVEVDPVVFDLDTLRNCWKDAGTYAGIGEMRPVYGRYKATIEEVSK